MSRADKIRPEEKSPEYYSDFPINMDRNPTTGNMARVTNAESVKQSIMNLILTAEHERFYRPYVGSKVKQSLFDPASPITMDSIRSSIEDVINNYEPRANIVRIDINDNIDGNAYNAHIHFSIENVQQVQSVSLSLERVR